MKLFFTLVALIFTVAINATGNIDSVPREKPSPANISDGSQRIVIRCGSTCRDVSCAPLFILDGVVWEYEMGQLDPNDIVSIDILKGAAATALYGYRGSNGVVIITTKTFHLRKFIVKDFLTGEKIPAATIRFTSGKDTINAVTDERGSLITDKLKTVNRYDITVSSAGYKTFSTIVSGNQQEILLERDVKECDNVIVSSTEGRRTIRCGMCTSIHREKGSTITGESIARPIYPNPVQRNNVFNLELENKMDETILVVITSLNGNTVSLQSKKINKGLNHFSIIADANWAAGIYNIQLRNEKGTLIRQEKLIVQ